MNPYVKRVDDFLSRIVNITKEPWWAWPAMLLAFALLTWACSLALAPGLDEWTYFMGHQVGDRCAMEVVTGLPCPSCGMTRSFVHAARFHWFRSFVYNPAGLTLFAWITAGGVVGAVRLYTRDPNRLGPSSTFIFRWTMLWAVGFYAIPWFLRLAGINPLP